jgi:hypothetical protein
MGMGFELVGLILGGQWLGSLIDQQYSFNGLGQAGMIMLVMAGWMYHLVVLLKRFMQDDNKRS